MAGRNVFKRQVGDAAIRASEHVLEISIDGTPYTLKGEMSAFVVASNSSNFTVPILGTGGKEYNDQAISSHTLTLTYNVGTDGSIWDEVWFRKLDGYQPDISVMSTKDDWRSVRKNGGRAIHYPHCRIINHSGYDDASGSGTGTAVQGTVTLETMDTPKLIQKFKPVQAINTSFVGGNL